MTLEEFLSEWNNASDVVQVHTSGSTGKPKPMWVEKRKMVESAVRTCDFLGLKRGDTALLCMPLDYIAGKMMVVRALVRGLRLVVVEPSGHPMISPDPSKGGEAGSSPLTISPPLEGLGEVPATFDFAAMVPMQVYNSLQVPAEREKLMKIRHLLIGGGAVDEAIEEELRDFPNAVWSSYGMTETLSHIALRRINGADASQWYTPMNGVRVSLNADDCLVIHAPHLSDVPLVTNDRGETSPAPSKGGEAGSSPLTISPPLAGAGEVLFRILGRADNVICSGGIKIQAEEVERVLRPLMHTPYLITKQRDEKFGEIVVLLTEDSDLHAVESFCKSSLPKFWQPRRYVHIDRLPMTETGKPARAQAERYVANL